MDEADDSFYEDPIEDEEMDEADETYYEDPIEDEE